jgi:hypothetical protein
MYVNSDAHVCKVWTAESTLLMKGCWLVFGVVGNWVVPCHKNHIK